VPDGWQVRRGNRGVIFEPVKMNRGEKLEIWIVDSFYEAKGASAQAQLAHVREKAKAMEGDCQPPQDAPPRLVLAMQACKEGDTALQYMLLRHGKHSAQLLRVRAAGNGVLERYQDGFQQVMQLARQNKVSKAANRYIARAVRTAPGQGVPDGDIAAVHVEWEQVRNGMSMRMEYTTRLLLKDGTGYRDPFPPDELNVKVSRQLEPGRWFQWRKPLFGNGYEMRANDDKEWRPLPKGWFAQPARPGERFDGFYSNYAVYGSWTTGTSTSKSSWYFKKDGTFETSHSAGSVSGALLESNGSVVGSSSHANARGSSTTTSIVGKVSDKPNARPVIAGGITRRADDGASRRGRYRLGGWVLEVERDDGSAGRYFVSFQSDKRDSINIGDAQYRIPKP